MSIYNLIEDGDNYSKTSGILWQHCKDEAAINAANGNTIDFNVTNATTDLLEIKEKK